MELAWQKYRVYLVGPAFGKLFLILRERFLRRFLLLKIFLTLMPFSLLSESFGQRPLAGLEIGKKTKSIICDSFRKFSRKFENFRRKKFRRDRSEKCLQKEALFCTNIFLASSNLSLRRRLLKCFKSWSLTFIVKCLRNKSKVRVSMGLTVNRQKRNIFTVNRQMSEPKLAVKLLR